MIPAGQELSEMHVDENGPRLEGAVRRAGTSEHGEGVEALPPHREMVLEDGEHLLAAAPKHALAVTAKASAGGDELRLHHVPARRVRTLAVGQPTARAAALSPNGRGVLILNDRGGVLFYDVKTSAYPGSSSTRRPEPGEPASVDLAADCRLWLAASGPVVEVRLIRDARPVATIDLAPLGDEVARAFFLPGDPRPPGLVVETTRGERLHFELLVDVMGPGREARVAAIADAVDAAIAGARWLRFDPRVDVYDERTVDRRTTLWFVADHHESHQAQSGSDWEEHTFCAGQATFEGDRCVEIDVDTRDARMISEQHAETYDEDAAFAAFRAETARRRSSSTVVRGGDAIRKIFNEHFQDDRLTLPESAIHHARGKYSVNGWDVSYRFEDDDGVAVLDVYARHRLTNDRLYRVRADGGVDLVASTTDGVLEDVDRAFADEVHRRFSRP